MKKVFRKSISLLLTIIFMITFVVGENAGLIYADSSNTITIHYYRFDANYSGWNAYAWDPNAATNQDAIAKEDGYQFTSTDSFGEVTKITTTTQTKIGFVIRNSIAGNPWANKDVSTDRFVDNISGNKDIWILQGDSNVYETEPTKLQSMHSFIDGKNYIDVKLKSQITLDATESNGFTVSKYSYSSKQWTPVNITSAQNAIVPVDDGKTPEQRGYQVLGSTQVKFVLKPGNFGFADTSGNLNVYISGDMNAWGGTSAGSYTVKPDWKMAWDAANSEYTLTVPIGSGSNTVSFGNGFKFTSCNADGSNVSWYPGGMGNNIILQNVGGTVSSTTNYVKLNLSENADIASVYKVTYAGYLDSYALVRNELSSDNSLIYNGSDLGAVYSPKNTAFKLWAPTASMVSVKVFDSSSSKDVFKKYEMYKYKNGTWAAKVKGNLDGKYYLYDIVVPVNGSFKEYNVADPYSKGSSANSEMSLVYNPKEVNAQVPNWSNDKYVSLKNNTDAVLYESHVRDLSIDSSSGVKSDYRGKYLAFTQAGTKSPANNSTGIDYLKELGVTHVHLLPTFDYGTGDENNESETYNWGYDPIMWDNVEGTYATNPNGTARQVEYKKMVQALHSNNIGLVTDVVFNHTLSTGEGNKSIFDKIVPGYYYRIDNDGNYSNASGCGNEVASDKPMVRKYILDSIKYWMKEYHIDGLRFDLMAALDKETMLEVKNAAKKINPNAIIYGEAWNASSSILDPSQQMDKVNAKGTGVAVFNDEIREDVKGDNDANVKGFAQGGGFRNGRERFDNEIKGESSFVASPNESINYVSCHDNYDLWDNIAKNNSGVSEDIRKKMSNLANGIILTSQGIPFIHQGAEFGRTKAAASNPGNTYNSVSGNDIDWKLRDSNSDMVKYYENLIALRKAHPAFRMTDDSMIDNTIKFAPSVPDKTEEYVISNNANGDDWKNILVVYNGSSSDETINVGGKWNVVAKGETVSLENPIETAENKVTVPAYSMLIAYTNSDYGYPVTTITSSSYSIDATNGVISLKASDSNTNVGDFISKITKGSSSQVLNVFSKGADVTNTANAKQNTDIIANGDILLVSDFGAVKAYSISAVRSNKIILDGQIEDGYGMSLGSGSGNSWGAVVDSVYAGSDGSSLYVAVKMNPKNAGNNIWLMLDDTSMSTGLTDLTGDAWANYGNLGITNAANINVDYVISGFRNNSGAFTLENERTITNYNAGYAAGCIDHAVKTVGVAQKTDYADGSAVYEFKIPYSSIGTGANAGDIIRPYVLFGKDANKDHPDWGGIRSIFPIQTDISANPLTILDKVSEGLKLN